MADGACVGDGFHFYPTWMVDQDQDDMSDCHFGRFDHFAYRTTHQRGESSTDAVGANGEGYCCPISKEEQRYLRIRAEVQAAVNTAERLPASEYERFTQLPENVALTARYDRALAEMRARGDPKRFRLVSGLNPLHEPPDARVPSVRNRPVIWEAITTAWPATSSRAMTVGNNPVLVRIGNDNHRFIGEYKNTTVSTVYPMIGKLMRWYELMIAHPDIYRLLSLDDDDDTTVKISAPGVNSMGRGFKIKSSRLHRLGVVKTESIYSLELMATGAVDLEAVRRTAGRADRIKILFDKGIALYRANPERYYPNGPDPQPARLVQKAIGQKLQFLAEGYPSQEDYIADHYLDLNKGSFSQYISRLYPITNNVKI